MLSLPVTASVPTKHHTAQLGVALTRLGASRLCPWTHDSRVTLTRNNGFTLIELIVAMGIFAILALMAYGGLDSVILSKEHTQAELQRTRQIQLTFNHLQTDIEQIINRPARDELGGELPALSAGQGDDLLMQFTRGGRPNPAKQTRSTLLRVAWKLEDGKLERIIWPFVDRAQDARSITTPLLDKVSEVKLRFLDAQNAWHDTWPSINQSVQPGQLIPLPLAAEVTLVLKDWGEITRLIPIGVQ